MILLMFVVEPPGYPFCGGFAAGPVGSIILIFRVRCHTGLTVMVATKLRTVSIDVASHPLEKHTT